MSGEAEKSPSLAIFAVAAWLALIVLVILPWIAETWRPSTALFGVLCVGNGVVWWMLLLWASHNLAFQIWSLWNTPPPPAHVQDAHFPVAILYTTCDDFSEEALRSCVRQRTTYREATVYVLDDSRDERLRAHIREVCSTLGCTYVSRGAGRDGLKAGNLNHALRTVAREPWFLLVDADQRLPENYLARLAESVMLGGEPAYIQAAQVSGDRREMNPFQRGLALDVSLFYFRDLVSRQRHGFVPMLGHGALVSRAAWEQVGGFPAVVSEDYAFAMNAVGRGLGSRYVHAVASEEEFPVDFGGFIIRLRKYSSATADLLRRHVPRFIASDATWTEKWDCLMLVGWYLTLPLVVVNSFASAYVVHRLRLEGQPYLAPVLPYLYTWMTFTVLGVIAGVARQFWDAVRFYFWAIAVYSAAIPVAAAALFRGLLGHARFDRTPKNGSETPLSFAIRRNGDARRCGNSRGCRLVVAIQPLPALPGIGLRAVPCFRMAAPARRSRCARPPSTLRSRPSHALGAGGDVAGDVLLRLLLQLSPSTYVIFRMRLKNAAALLLLCLSTFSFAQTAPPPPPAPADAPPQPAPLHVPKSASAVDLDGALNDPAWQGAAVIDRFYETNPGDNVQPKVKTTAYITYDSRYFYIGIKADDPEPRRIRAPFVDRDGVIGTDDNIAIFLDTRNDKRSAIELRVNPRGIQADGIFNDANGNEDFSPDFYYDTAAQITSEGWTAEFRIPFSSLRYGSADPQTWNILIWRNYPREFRYFIHSAPMPRGSNCLVCFAHPLTGLTGLPEAAHFVAAPYVTAQQVARPEAGLGSNLESGDGKYDGGLDVKWTPSANNAIDFTVNPDFSQIETDVPQIAVNQRFALFFAEKRPFFLEGFDLFDTPMQVAYTRTITDPRAGARATGKFGDTAYTVLTTQDEGGGLTIIPGPTRSGFAPLDAKSFSTIARVRHDLGRGFLGAVMTDREISGGGHNRVIGPDFQWRWPNDVFTAQLLYSDTENPVRPESPVWNGESSSSHALAAFWDHRTRTIDFGAGYNDVGEGFRADLGFIPQVGYRRGYGYLGYSFYPEGKVRFVRPSVLAEQQQDRDGDVIFETLSLGVSGFGAKNTQFSAVLRLGERIRVGDELLEQNYAQLFYQFDPYRRIPRITLQARLGEQIDFDNGREGEGLSLSAGATVRPHDRLDLQFLLARDAVDVDGDRLFTAMIERVRGQYSFSAKSLVRVIAQYVTTDYNPSNYLFPVPEKDGAFLGSVLYSYKLNWQTVLFAGYGDDRLLLEDDRLARTGRSFFFKVSYAFIR